MSLSDERYPGAEPDPGATRPLSGSTPEPGTGSTPGSTSEPGTGSTTTEPGATAPGERPGAPGAPGAPTTEYPAVPPGEAPGSPGGVPWTPGGTPGHTGDPGPGYGNDPADWPQPGWRGPRLRTVVWGLAMLAIAASSLVASLTDTHVDGAKVGVAIVLLAGVLLVTGGTAAAVREARASRRPHPRR